MARRQLDAKSSEKCCIDVQIISAFQANGDTVKAVAIAAEWQEMTYNKQERYGHWQDCC
jgi:hypothetical protein